MTEMLRISHLQELCPHLPLAIACSKLPDAVVISSREGTHRPFLALLFPYYVISFSYAFVFQSIVWGAKRRWSCREGVSCAWTFCSVELWAAWDHWYWYSKNKDNQTLGDRTYFHSVIIAVRVNKNAVSLYCYHSSDWSIYLVICIFLFLQS